MTKKDRWREALEELLARWRTAANDRMTRMEEARTYDTCVEDLEAVLAQLLTEEDDDAH